MPRAKVDNPETKARIIEAAESLFAERGYDGVAVREVAALAGVNTALVHYYFESKANLYGSVFLNAAADLGRMADAVAETPGTATDKLRAYVHGFARMILTRPERPRLVMRELLNGAPVMGQVVANGVRPPHLRVLREIAERGVASGELRPIDFQLLPLTVIGMVVHYATARPLLHVAVDAQDFDDAFVDRVAAHIADTLLNGVAPIAAGPPPPPPAPAKPPRGAAAPATGKKKPPTSPAPEPGKRGRKR